MPAVFNKLGIHFLYPDNWSLDEDEAVEGNRSVTVNSPSGAFWSIVVHDRTANPAELASSALMALKVEYPESEAEPISEEIGEETIRGYDLNFFYLDFVSMAVIRGFRTDTASCLVLCQAEDREFEKLAPIFRAITTSLLAQHSK